MSVEVMARVWKYAPVDGTELLMLLAMADFAHDDGSNVFPAVKKLAAKVRMSERRAQEVLQSLRDKDLIERQEKKLNGPWIYRIKIENLTIRGAETRTPLDERGAETRTPGVRDLAPPGDRHLLNESPINHHSSASPAAKRVEYTKAFEAWWDVYGKRGSKMEAFREWNKLGAEDRAAAVTGAPAYLASTNYAVEGRRYLHGRWWEKEVLSPNGKHEPTEDEKAYWRARVEATRDGKVFDEKAWRDAAATAAETG